MSIRKYFAPINPLGYTDISEWKPDPKDESKIIGTWAEDGSEYGIICPHQLRNQIMAMQNLLPHFLELVGQEFENYPSQFKTKNQKA